MSKTKFTQTVYTVVILTLGAWIGIGAGVVLNMLLWGWLSTSNLAAGLTTTLWFRLINVTIGLLLLFGITPFLQTTRLRNQVFKNNYMLQLFFSVLTGAFGFGMAIFYVFIS